ncbi:23S rRNA (guanosine(2251)-2'-O)-methyltransferase RlmB [Pelagibius sp. 7325]|uniref:23S rRNA (guanosine(2251)-2'-O)-methyltransferase RlmB n=1 Tax=Pelagibius sp. 7325 TaxID=3131994 RepID=UPI0030EE4354
MTKRKDKLGSRGPRGAKSGSGARAERAGARPEASRSGGRSGGPGPRPRGSSRPLWLFGGHAVLAALGNPNRRPERLMMTAEAAQTWGQQLRDACDPRHAGLATQTVQRRDIDALLPEGSVHQGLALATAPLHQPALEDIFGRNLADSAQTPQPNRRVVVLLDQVTDPHNVGAVLRSAAAFGALAVVALDKGAPEESGTLAKAASGAFEVIPYISVVNLARALDSLKEAGFWCLGLAGEARQSLAESSPGEAVALVLGAEGPGLRRLTRERCDLLVKLPTRPPIDSLNVSNAAAVALYELLGRA